MDDREVTAQSATPIHPAQFNKTSREGMSNRRPKLLFLAYYFPPLRAISCVRTSNIAKYLARLGWDVTVVTPHPSAWRHVDNPQETIAALEREGIRRILTSHRWRCLSPDHLNCRNQGLSWFVGGVCRKLADYTCIDREIGWIKAVEQACAFLTAKDVDVILATGSPFIVFELARYLSDRLDCPYVLDYRDPWTGNPHASNSARSAVVQKEAGLLTGCAAVTIVSPSWALAMDKRFNIGPKLHVITNGYDPEELADIKPYDFGHFAIVYTGNFYPPKRVISPVIAVLKRLQETLDSKGDKWYFHYYGGQENHVREEAKRLNMMDRVVLHGRVPRIEALSAVQGADIAIVITSVAEEATIEDKGMVTGKVFEALGLRTPILLISPSGSDVKIITETTGLGRSFTANDIDGMASFLTDVMCGLTLEPKNLQSYVWKNIAKRLDDVLRGVVVNDIYNKTQPLS